LKWDPARVDDGAEGWSILFSLDSRRHRGPKRLFNVQKNSTLLLQNLVDSDIYFNVAQENRLDKT
jgi:hypothetical protein